MLGVVATAPVAEIKRAYRQLVVRYHPDKHGGDARYEDQFKAVAQAYRVLSDPGRRATYDFQLAQAARRAEEARRQQQHRPATQHVYGVPMPPPAPLRTRPPAGSRERHYQAIPRRQTRFNRRDWLLTALVLLGIFLAGWALQVVMARLNTTSHYEDGLQAYNRKEWPAAYSHFSEALHFQPNFGPALRRRAEIAQFVYHDPADARTDYQQALLQAPPRPQAAQLLYRLGQCHALLNEPDSAELSFSNALALDSTLAAVYLARGRERLLRQARPQEALADLRQGLRLRQQASSPPPWESVRLMGLALAKLRRYDEAFATYNAVAKAQPDNGLTYYLMACLAEQTGDQPAACVLFRQAHARHYAFNEQQWRSRCPE